MFKKIRLNSKSIVFEDDNYIIITKLPKEFLLPSESKFNLVDSLKSFIRQRDRLMNRPTLFLANKLAKEEMGLILFAKNRKAKLVLKEVLAKKKWSGKTDLVFFDPISKKKIAIKKQKGNLSKKKEEEKLYFIFNKPYNVLCQFTKEKKEELCLSDFDLPKEIYPAGRLDKDSEGLLLLTNDGNFIHKLSNPRHEKEKTYLVQVEGIPDKVSLDKLQKGVVIQGYQTKPAKVKKISDPNIPERLPPIRFRKNIPTSWVEIKITEGKNRQVRRMTAAVGFPTLRLIRVSIGCIKMPIDLTPGEFKEINL